MEYKGLICIIILLIVSWIIFPILLSDSNNDVKVPDNERFLVVDNGSILDNNTDLNYCIVVDNNTGVEYYVTNNKNSRGILCPLYDAEGKLLTIHNDKPLD